MINRIDKIVCSAPFSRKIVLVEPAYHDGRSLGVNVTEDPLVNLAELVAGYGKRSILQTNRVLYGL